MAFFRFNRDKRGYEHFYLVEPITNRRGKTRSRILYWYRTPPNVRVGRAPFDDEVQRALEAQHPGVSFDWRKIVDAPIPSADVEKWRERRRAERAEKAARHHVPTASDLDEPIVEGDGDADTILGEASAAPPVAAAQAPFVEESVRKRRRRRRGGQRRDASAPQPDIAPAAPDAAAHAPAPNETAPIDPTSHEPSGE
jgi:hypothetical protein